MNLEGRETEVVWLYPITFGLNSLHCGASGL